MNRPPASRFFSCLSTGAIAAGILAVLVFAGLTMLSRGGLFSPGPLNAQAAMGPLGGVASHAEISDCAQCHPLPWSGQTAAARCQVCHTDLTQDPTNFHNLITAPGQLVSCLQCHTDHRGPAAALTKMDSQSFPHDKLGYSLRAHAKMNDGSAFQCSGCHPAGYGRFELQVCADCHGLLNPAFMPGHTAAFGTDCLSCHDGVDSYGHTFDHSRVSFALSGKHASAACAGCHGAAPLTLAVLKAAPQDCFSCHASIDAHQGGLGVDCGQCHTPQNWQTAKIDHSLTAFPLAGKHASVSCQDCHQNGVFKGLPKDCFSCHQKDDAHQGDLGRDCGQCHTPLDWQQATLDHSLTAFPLIGKHQTAACTDCHANHVFKGTPKDCFSCHQKDDAHQGDLGLNCGGCHTPTGWLPATVDHSLTRFPLVGKHIGVDCQACHVNNVFKGTPGICYACHAKDDAHKGQFGQDCGLCHIPAGWLPPTFDHAKTIFPLTGAHLRVACVSCHRQGAGGIVFAGTPSACSACHADPAYHQGLFGLNCVSCHNTAAWVPATFNQPHTFPINHGGAGSTCRNCHPTSLSTYTCYKCHDQSQMASRHQENGITDLSNCARCHASGRGGN